MERDPGQHAALAEQPPGQRERPVKLFELVVDGYAQCLEDALGRMTLGEAGRSRDRRVDRVDQLERRLDRRLRSPADDRSCDCVRVTLLAEVPQRAGQPLLV